MKITQLSVFLENKSGRLNEITRILSDAGVNMDAFCLAEASDFGILRMVVSNVERAMEVLRAARVAVSQTQVVLIECPNKAGELGKILDRLAREGVFIEYMYAYAKGDTANIVIRPTDVDKCLANLN